MKKRTWLALFFLPFLLACAGTGGHESTGYGQAKVIDVPFTKLVRATADYLSNRGYRVIISDLDNGIIKTDYRSGAGWAQRGSRGERRAKVEAKIERIDDTHSKLTLEIYAEVRELNTPWELVDGGSRDALVIYGRFFDGITTRAKEM
ncbi:MAG TPA: hypothetical protein ENH29_08380 [Bacteroidetes bacterium]|nr:hypothetical protein [Bacteroidota bacterium]